MESVLADSHGLQAESLALTLGAVRHRRRRRYWQRTGAVLAAVLLLGLLMWQGLAPRPVAPSVAGPDALPRSFAEVASKPLAAGELVVSSWQELALATSDAAGLGWVETSPQEASYGVLSDDGLLGLVGGNSVALVRSEGEARLILDAANTLKLFGPQ